MATTTLTAAQRIAQQQRSSWTIPTTATSKTTQEPVMLESKTTPQINANQQVSSDGNVLNKSATLTPGGVTSKSGMTAAQQIQARNNPQAFVQSQQATTPQVDVQAETNKYNTLISKSQNSLEARQQQYEKFQAEWNDRGMQSAQRQVEANMNNVQKYEKLLSWLSDNQQNLQPQTMEQRQQDTQAVDSVKNQIASQNQDNIQEIQATLKANTQATANKISSQLWNAIDDFLKTWWELNDGTRDQILMDLLWQNWIAVDWNDANFRDLVDGVYWSFITWSGGNRQDYYGTANTKLWALKNYLWGKADWYDIQQALENGNLNQADINQLRNTDPNLYNEYKIENKYTQIKEDAMTMAQNMMDTMMKAQDANYKQQMEVQKENQTMMNTFAKQQSESLLKYVNDFQANQTSNNQNYVDRLKETLNTQEIIDKTASVNEVEKEIDDLRTTAMDIEEEIRAELWWNATDSYIQALVQKRTKQYSKQEMLLMNRYEQESGDLQALIDWAKQDFELQIKYEESQKADEYRMFEMKYGIQQQAFDQQRTIFTDNMWFQRDLAQSSFESKQAIGQMFLWQAMDTAQMWLQAEIQSEQADVAYQRSEMSAEKAFQNSLKLWDIDFERKVKFSELGIEQQKELTTYTNSLDLENKKVLMKLWTDNAMELMQKQYTFEKNNPQANVQLLEVNGKTYSVDMNTSEVIAEFDPIKHNQAQNVIGKMWVVGATWWQCGEYVNDVLWIWHRWDGTPHFGNSIEEKKEMINSQNPTEWAWIIFDVGTEYGHVWLVKSVNADGTITVNESNWKWDEIIWERTISVKDKTISGYFVPEHNIAVWWWVEGWGFNPNLQNYYQEVLWGKTLSDSKLEAIKKTPDQVMDEAQNRQINNVSSQLNMFGAGISDKWVLMSYSPKEIKEVLAGMAQLNSYISEVDEVIGMLENWVPRVWTKEYDTLEPKLNNLRIKAKEKEYFNLWVLNWPDLTVLEWLIPSITPYTIWQQMSRKRAGQATDITTQSQSMISKLTELKWSFFNHFNSKASINGIIRSPDRIPRSSQWWTWSKLNNLEP